LVIRLRQRAKAMSEKRSKYLLLEDNGADIEIAFFDFQEHGMEKDFHVSINAENALEYLFEEDGSFRIDPPKAIFLDLHLPRMSGLEFLRVIKKNQQSSYIPVVVMVSSASPGELDECKSLGVKRFINKPLEYENFRIAIKELSDSPLVTTVLDSNLRPSKDTEGMDL
jgi:two-component system, response regulator